MFRSGRTLPAFASGLVLAALLAVLVIGALGSIAWRSLTLATVLLNVAVLAAGAILFARQSRRQRELAEQLALEKQQLERRTRQHALELAELSTHLQQLTERDKTTLARRLHDELGGLLIAAKMDVVWLQRRWRGDEPQTEARWSRVLKLLDDGVTLKRRLVETLHPTLLDNVGLFAALRWLLQETCEPAGLEYGERLAEPEPRLSEDAALMAFRLVQESLTNVVRHARASRVWLEVGVQDEELRVRVSDNGRGIERARLGSSGTQGLATMRHRVLVFGGELQVDALPGCGTRVCARVPLAPLLRDAGREPAARLAAHP